MAAKKKIALSEQQIRPAAKELSSQDPVQRMPMVVSIENIQTYDKNPRKHENESFNEIKESIRLKGLEQPFTITKRPGEENYIIKAGGNTRLTALQELYQETGDDKFLNVHVIYEPFVSEADTLISHLTENDLRGNLMLIDRAQGIRDTKLSIESEKGFELSDRELSAVLKEQGYSIDNSLIGILDYALERLYPYLPMSLDAGMGKPQVLKIRKFEKQAKQAWQDLEVSLEEFESTFNQALTQSDQDKFDFNVLVDAFETVTAEVHELSINTVRFFVERAMTVNRKPTAEELAAYKAEQKESESDSDTSDTSSSEGVSPAEHNEPENTVSAVEDDDLDEQLPFAHDLEQEEDDAEYEEEEDVSEAITDDSLGDDDSSKDLTRNDLRATSLALA
ncbi:MAG: ParB N-terminal domain-containing protein, partial [Hydrogenovibrio crunogenus]|nr:ParB N-terminal domain-containing protein [Hydrogenovibrio crunogenus]